MLMIENFNRGIVIAMWLVGYPHNQLPNNKDQIKKTTRLLNIHPLPKIFAETFQNHLTDAAAIKIL